MPAPTAFSTTSRWNSVRRFEAELYRFVENAHPGILQTIREKKAIDDALKAEIKNVLKEFKERFVDRGARRGR